MANGNYHTDVQLQTKRDAIDDGVRDLSFDYKAGKLAGELGQVAMYYRLDQLHALLTELRKG